MSNNAAAVASRWARATEQRLKQTFIQAAQTVATNVSVGGKHSPGTPVDTGFARTKWAATFGDPPTETVPKPKGLKENELLAAGDAAASAMNLTIASADITTVVTVHNNTNYLQYLEEGIVTPKKKQFHKGWIAETVHAWPTIVLQASRIVRKAFG